MICDWKLEPREQDDCGWRYSLLYSIERLGVKRQSSSIWSVDQ